VNLQAKLLRILQEMEFERVGGKDRIRVHARIIAATNKDLKTLVKEGKFRDDLFYRLNIVAITIPPLRARTDDIPALVDYLLAKINIDLHKRIVGVSGEMMGIFLNYRWPGNVRELENLLVRAAVVAKGQILIRGDFPELAEEPEAVQKDVSAGKSGEGRSLTLDNIEEQYIRKVIRESGKNKGEICEILGISRPTFERKLEKYGISFDH
jgi:two-component system response regulator AtoC